MEDGKGGLEGMDVTTDNNSVNDAPFWRGKKVFITGHTGFKGSWLSLWLTIIGADVTGYSLRPDTSPNLFDLCGVEGFAHSIYADVRDLETLKKTMRAVEPDIVIHMAAQPLVRSSYLDPVGTYQTNVMGTVNVLESVRNCNHTRAVINVTTDKCYFNQEWEWGYRENDRLGGFDPYSSSKACSELVSEAYLNSYFDPTKFEEHGTAIATARAGNVIGGGDWAQDRLIPDCVRALLKREALIVRNPFSIRPWQHVLEPLSGYLQLAKMLYNYGTEFNGAWNFGPSDEDAQTVEWVVRKMCEAYGAGTSFEVDDRRHPHEATFLKLDCSKAKTYLGWAPRWSLSTAIDKVVEWIRAFETNSDIHQITFDQIKQYMSTPSEVRYVSRY